MNKDIKKETLKKIKKDQIKVKPKSYFQVLKVLLYGFSVTLALIAIYTVNLLFYLPGRAMQPLPMGTRPSFFSLFPWPLLIFGSLIIGLLIFLYQNYEGGYKRNILISAGIIFFIILFGGAIISGLRINERLEQKPHFQKFYQWNEDNFVPRGPRDGSGRGRRYPTPQLP